VNSTYTYDSYDNLTASTGSLVNSFRYTGREFGSETNLYYYAPHSTTWAPDGLLEKIHFDSGGASIFFSYVRNSPMTLGLYAHAYLLVTDNNFTFYFRGGPEHGHRSGDSSGASSASSSGSSGSSSGGLGEDH